MSNNSKENQIEVIEQSIDPVAQLTFDGLTYPIILPNADTDYIQKKLHSERVPYELDMLKDMQRRLSKGDSVLDIGANIGNHTLFLAVVAQCKVIAFEPNEALCGPLLKSIELNRLAKRVSVRPVALGKVKGEGHFAKLVPENMGAQSITVGKGGIPISPLDSFKFSQPIKAIKIDVEGMELDVLEGGIHRIQTDRPIIYVECQTEKEFRTIHDWFSKIDYGYWDTFNATPTHLFLPNERTTLDQRIARLQFKIVQDDYRVNIQLPAVRQKLEDAQVKYRTATEQINALKQQVAQEGTAHQAAQQAQAQATTQLKAELEAMRGKLEEANQKYRGATEQVTALKQQVAQEGTAHQAAQQAQAQATTQLKAELEAMRGKLEEANQKYRGATEQVTALKQQVAQEGTAHQAAQQAQAQATTQLKAELEAMRGRLEEANQKYRGATEQVTALKQQVAQEGTAHQAAQQAQAQATTQLKAELEAMRGKLEEANQKYRGATEQVTALKQQVAQEGTAHQAAQQAQVQATTQLKAELEAMRGRLEEANQKYRGAAEQLSALKHRATQEEAMQQGAEKVRAQAAAQLAEVHRSFQDEREVFQQQLAQLSLEEQAKTATIYEGEKKLIRLEAELEARSRLDEANQKYQAATEQVSRLTQQAKQEDAARKTAEQALQAAEVKLNGLDSELAALRTRLEDANQKYRGATEQISTFISDSKLRSEQNVTAPIEGTKTGSQLPDVHTVEYKNISYMQRQKRVNSASDQVFDGKPLISVIMTTYNTIDFIDAAVKSILNQSWRNLELIIVDDCSTDGTRQCAERYAQTDKRVRVFCFGENRGTYWCKNYGITLAAGVVITFMDSDDICHESRLEEQFAELNKQGRAMVTCNWVRKDGAGNLVVINGVIERIAFISKMVKRRVIDEIGYFDTIRTSADDEFIKRVKLVYGNRAHFNVPKVLYTGAHRENSLTTDPENLVNLSASRDSNVPILSPQRAHYGGSYVGWHKELVSKGMVPYMPFPVVNRPFPVYGKLLVKGNRYDGNAISACLASFPPRKEQLKKTVHSIIDRVDAIYVYLNEYLEVPDFLIHPRIHVILGVNRKGDLRDNGKFYFSERLLRGYCFTIDDDIDYPCDYFEALIRKIEFYDRKAVIGVHGTIFAKPVESYFKDRKVHSFRMELRRDAVVNQLGTGTVGFHTDLWRPSLEWFTEKGMADVFFAIEAKRRNITLIAMERPRGWLKSQDMSEGKARGLYEEFLSDDVVQTKLIKAWAPFDEVVRGELSSHLAQRASLGDPFLTKAVAIEKTDNVDLSGNSLPDRSRAA